MATKEATKTKRRQTRGPIGEELRRLKIPVNSMAKSCGVSNKTAWRWAMGDSRPLPGYTSALKRFFTRVSPDFDLEEALK